MATRNAVPHYPAGELKTDGAQPIPILRWGKPYESLETDAVVHFVTGEPIAKVSQANGGLMQRDMRQAQRARDVLRAIPATN